MRACVCACVHACGPASERDELDTMLNVVIDVCLEKTKCQHMLLLQNN